MKTQNQIKRKLSESTSIEYICGLIGSKDLPHRTALSAVVCEQFAFYDARGQPQQAGCLKALREREAAGHFTLPTARRRPGRASEGLGTVVRGLVDRPALAKAMRLRPEQRVILAQSVGYLKKQ